jgi:hypothetical protein
VEAFPIRRRDAFEVFGARRAADGRPCTVVMPGPEADPGAAAEALAELARVHALVEHPLVALPSASGEEEGRPFVEFDVPAIADATELIRLLPTAPRKIPYPAADAFIYCLRQALDAAHAATDPRTGRPSCLGRFSGGNVLVDAEGRWYLVGLGHNVACLDEHGVVDGTVASFHPPEISAGGAPSPGGDYVALITFMRSVLQYVALPRLIVDLLRGLVTASGGELAELFRWFERRVVAELPGERASVAEAVDVSERIRRILRTRPDPDAFAAYAAELLRDNGLPPSPRALATGTALLVATDESWVESGGERQKVGGAQRRMLAALLAAHEASPTRSLRVWELFEAGWPGERASYEASLNRVYVGLNRLRAKGLREVIERYDDGWRVAPAVRVRRSTD